MNYHVLTLFPDMIRQGCGTSITGRALKKGIITLDAIDIRDYAEDARHRRVDDYTYGGGAGMLMQAQPVYDAWKAAAEGLEGRKVRTIYVTPQGTPFTQRIAEDLARSDDLIFICGHYEGIDERVLEEVVTDYISIGDYVLTGGELAAMVMIDAVSRLVPGVLHNEESADTESFHADLLEYPQYSRPEKWHGKEVPAVLLSGNQKQIDAWRLETSVERTRERRPDLYQSYLRSQEVRSRLMKNKKLHIDMINLIDQGMADIIFSDGQGILLHSRLEKENFLYAGNDPEGAAEFVMQTRKRYPEKQITLLLHGQGCCAFQAVLTRREKLPVTGLYRPDGKPTPQGLVIREAENGCLKAFQNEEYAGEVRFLRDGRIEELWVEPSARRQHIGLALTTCACNHLLGMGIVPYCRFAAEEQEAAAIAKKLGFYTADGAVCGRIL